MRIEKFLTIIIIGGLLYSQDVTLSFGSDDYLGIGSAEILIENSEAVYGFQFNVTGVTITESTAGDVVPGDWMLSASESTVLGFSLMGTSFPAGSGVLVNLTYVETGGDVCIENGVVSGEGGTSLEVGYGGCMPSAPLPSQVDLSITDFSNNMLEINMLNTENVAGFQFELESSFPDFEIVGVSGGSSSDNGFMLSHSATTIIGFSLSGDVIQPGDGPLVYADITFTGESGTVQIANSVFSAVNGDPLVVNNGDPYFIEVNVFTIGCNDPEALNYNPDADGCNEDDPADFSCCDYPIDYHFNVDLDETGEFQLVIFEESISILEPGDEIGVFDANGVLESCDPADGCSDPGMGEVLVGAGAWTGEQLEISAIMSVDLSDFGGPVLNGAVDGNPVVVKIWDASEGTEHIVQNVTWSTGSGHFGDLILSISELELTPPHFNVELDETGEFQLVIFESSISLLEPGDEIGVYDADGVITGGSDPVYGEVLVGAGAWTGEQLEISAIMSVDLSDFGGPVLNGAVDGNPVIIKIWKASEEMEYTVNAEWSSGSGNFGDLILAVSELTMQAGFEIIINEFFFRAAVGTGVPDYIELYNLGSDDVDLTGWTLDDEELSGSIASGGFLLVSQEDPFFNADGDELYAGEDIPNSVYADISLSTSSGTIELIDADGNTVAEFSYDENEGWPVGNDNRGHAAELTDPESDIADPSNWASADEDCTSDILFDEDGNLENFGSPGEANCNGPQPDCAGVINGDAFTDDCDVCICGPSGLGDCVDQEPNADLDCAGVCFGDSVVDDCGICGGDGSTCAAYIESEITTTVEESMLEDMETFEDDFESYIETALDLPDGTVEVISVTILRDDVEIIIEYTITLTEEELEETDFGSSEDLEEALDEVEDDIESDTDDGEGGGLDFIYGCADDNACNYDPEVTVDDGSCTYPEGTCDCDGIPLEGYCACDGSVEDDCGVCDDNPDNDNEDMDCAGVCSGDAYEDDCGVCDDDPGNDNTDLDCAGVCFGDAYEDICGACDDIPSNDNLECSGCTDPEAVNFDGDALADCSAEPGGDDLSCCDYTTEVEYDIVMHNGSNLISFYALPDDISVPYVMGDLGECVTGVIGEGVAASHLGGGTWVGSLSEIASTSGYWVKLNDDCTLHVVGTPYDPSPTYDLHTGSNLISFPYAGIIGLSDGIPDGIEPLFIGVIGEGVAASQIAPFSWVGSLSQWEGTKGYWAKVYEPFEFNFIEPGLLMGSTNFIEEEIPAESEYYQSTEQAFYFVKDIIVDKLQDSDFRLQAFCNNNLVGSRIWNGDWIDIPAMGDDGDNFTSGYCQTGEVPEFIALNLNTGEEVTLTGSIPQWESNGLFTIETLTEVIPVPNQITLNPAYPNPFNPATHIEFGLPMDQQISLIIYDITGRRVTTLMDGLVESGFHRVQWNGTDNTGRTVSAGVYTAVLNNGVSTVSQKLVLLK